MKKHSLTWDMSIIKILKIYVEDGIEAEGSQLYKSIDQMMRDKVEASTQRLAEDRDIQERKPKPNVESLESKKPENTKQVTK